MLARENRLTDRTSFQRVQKEGRLVQSFSFGLSFLNRGDNNPSRFGFIVSNKISKESTKRNRIKRILREAVANILVDTKAGFDVVFLARQKLLEMDSREVTKETKDVFEKAGLIK